MMFGRLTRQPLRAPLHPETGMPLLDGLQLRPVESLQVSTYLNGTTPQALPQPHIPKRMLDNFIDAKGQGLIVVPENEYAKNLKNFTGAEGLAAIIFSSTAGFLTSLTTNPALLLVGSFIAEKIGLHLYAIGHELVKPSSQGNFSKRGLAVLKKTAKLLKTDLVFHDIPHLLLARGALSFFNLMQWPLTPTWSILISAATFGIALLLAPWFEIKTMQAIYENSLIHKGLRAESYYEQRFVLSDDCDPKQILEALSLRFNLNQRYARKFEDTYFVTVFPEDSSQEVLARERKVSVAYSQEKPVHHDFEIIISEIKKQKNQDGKPVLSTKKKKFATSLQDGTAANQRSLGWLWNRKIKRAPGFPTVTLEFLSYCARNDLMRVDLDIFPTEDGKAVYLLEIKAYPESKDLLSNAMEYLNERFGVAQTTRSPQDVVVALQGTAQDEPPQ